VLNLFVYNVVLTGHLVITFFLSFSIFGSFIFIAYMNYQTFYFYFYVPKGVKSPLKEGLVGIEFLSYVIRPFSLSIRLFANILAGHTLLHIFGSFFIYVLSNYPAVVFLPIVICLAITALEIAVAFIQAYVYFTLASIYLSDSYRLH
jgi:F-type H+-transporting ATPase subunit a